jgi:hypothetical protein
MAYADPFGRSTSHAALIQREGYNKIRKNLAYAKFSRGPAETLVVLIM